MERTLVHREAPNPPRGRATERASTPPARKSGFAFSAPTPDTRATCISSATCRTNCYQFLFQNNNGVPVNQEIKINTGFAVGEELVFKLFVGNTGDAWYTGPASNNSDNVAHFATQSTFFQTSNATYTLLGGFEDLPGGGDRDYNDLMFQFSNVSVTATPEPASMALMATGLASLGGFVKRRRRLQQQQQQA